MKKYSAIVNDYSRTVIIRDQDYPNKAAFIRDLRANGYKVNPKKVPEEAEEDFLDWDPAEVREALANSDKSRFDKMLGLVEQEEPTTHQETKAEKVQETPNWQARFLQNQADSYCIYHLKNNVEKAETAYENYDTFYAGELGELSAIGNVEKVLDELYMKLNVERPQGYSVHSLWAGDVVALKREGVTTYYRVTGTGYAQVQNFIPEPVIQI